ERGHAVGAGRRLQLLQRLLVPDLELAERDAALVQGFARLCAGLLAERRGVQRDRIVFLGRLHFGGQLRRARRVLRRRLVALRAEPLDFFRRGRGRVSILDAALLVDPAVLLRLRERRRREQGSQKE